ncbi:MAG TPA: sigma 54-interacting transcriptional regulator [Vicinamibacterales bacterium]|nr:sigma 54-interacting transcriptional regulator [Vicinamibacterales bacterium]
MGVSAFSHTISLPPEIERVSREICSLLDTGTAAPVEERLRETCARLLEGLGMDAALVLVPSAEFPTVSAGAGFVSERTITDLLSRPWMLAAIAQSDVAVVTGPPRVGCIMPVEEHRHLWALGIGTLLVVPLLRHSADAGVIVLCSQRPERYWESGGLTPLTDVADAVDAVIRQASGSKASTLAAALKPADAETWGDRRLRQPRLSPHPEDRLVGECAAWKYVIFRLDQVASTHATVLLQGETGTGKEVVARALHRRSTRSGGRFVALNCAALPATLVESELFGRERGAFTGAHTSQVGRFELAHHGTLFLDEIADLPVELQPKLLRVLQEGQLERLGSTRTVDVDVRVIAATNRDLAEEVRESRFRGDLYYRLNVFPITLPSLRERREDIPLLAEHLAEGFARSMRKPFKPIPAPVARALQEYDWPGNIRELENVIQRAMILSPNGTLSINDISLTPARATSTPSGTTLEEVERNHILRVLATTFWRIEGKRGAADMLGLKPSTLRSRIRKLGIRRGMS